MRNQLLALPYGSRVSVSKKSCRQARLPNIYLDFFDMQLVWAAGQKLAFLEVASSVKCYKQGQYHEN
jgi:UPF0288 family protein (methanogenesis marker protein 3)